MRIASNRGLPTGADDQIQKIMYERLLEFKILCEGKDKEIHDPKKNEANKVRVTTTSNRTGLLITTLEIFSENDPFFHYRTSIDVHDFQNIKTVSNLAIEFNEYPDYLIKVFNKTADSKREVNKDKGNTLASITMGIDGMLQLEIGESTRLKKNVLVYRNFGPLDLPVLRKKINADFRKLAEKIGETEDSVLHLVDTVRIKSPSVHDALMKLKVL
jgi:hypothetical protein